MRGDFRLYAEETSWWRGSRYNGGHDVREALAFPILHRALTIDNFHIRPPAASLYLQPLGTRSVVSPSILTNTV